MKRKNLYIYYSFIMFVLCASYVSLAYSTTYMLELGFSNTLIGVIQSVNAVFAFIMPPLFGLLADKLRSKRIALIILIIFNVIGYMLYPMILSYIPMLIMTSVFAGVRNAMDSLHTSWVISEIETAEKNGIRMNFGSIRLWGSFSYAVLSLLLNFMMESGFLTTRTSFFTGAVLLGIMLLALFFSPGRKDKAVSESVKPLTMKQLKPMRLFRNYYYVLYMIVFILIYMSSAFTLNYESNILTAIGKPTSLIGMLSAVRAGCEIPIIFYSHKVANRFGYEKCIIAVGIVFVICNIINYFTVSLFGMIMVEVLHGIFNGLFMAIFTIYLFTIVPKSLAATADTLNLGIYNILGMVLYIVGGQIIDNSGLFNVFILGAVIPLLGVIIFIAGLAFGKLKGIKRYNPDEDPVEQEIMRMHS